MQFWDRGRLRFRWRVPVQCRVRVSIRSQEVPGAEPTGGQWSPRTAALRVNRMVPFRVPFWLPRPHIFFHPRSRRPPESFRAPAQVLGNDMLSFQVPYQVSLPCFWTPVVWCFRTLELGPHGERALARVRVGSKDVTRAEATLVS